MHCIDNAMDCAEIDKRAKRLTAELDLIDSFDRLHAGDGASEHFQIGRRARQLRRVEINAELSCLYRQCRSENYRSAHREVTSRANSVSGRLATLLLEWRRSDSITFGQGSRIDLLLSHEQIAEKIGVTRETVSRTFSELKRRGILRGKRSTWVICNESALREIAGSF
jgi:CRP/FNR family transcriptional regulator, cyclic AMP receptor protein